MLQEGVGHLEEEFGRPKEDSTSIQRNVETLMARSYSASDGCGKWTVLQMTAYVCRIEFPIKFIAIKVVLINDKKHGKAI